jgi:hypothetical protein
LWLVGEVRGTSPLSLHLARRGVGWLVGRKLWLSFYARTLLFDFQIRLVDNADFRRVSAFD